MTASVLLAAAPHRICKQGTDAREAEAGGSQVTAVKLPAYLTYRLSLCRQNERNSPIAALEDTEQ